MTQIVNFDFGSLQKSNSTLIRIKTALKEGKVIAYPTDTFYGLGADPLNKTAVSEIFRIKNRPEEKPILVLIHSEQQLDSLVETISKEAKQLIEKLWPGPLTLIFRSKNHLPENLTAYTGTLGIRMPNNLFARNFLKAVGHPLTATSANLSASKNLTTAKEVREHFGQKVPIIIDGGKPTGDKSSTILDTTVSPPRLIRSGACPKEKIEATLKLKIHKL